MFALVLWGVMWAWLGCVKGPPPQARGAHAQVRGVHGWGADPSVWFFGGHGVSRRQCCGVLPALGPPLDLPPLPPPAKGGILTGTRSVLSLSAFFPPPGWWRRSTWRAAPSWARAAGCQTCRRLSSAWVSPAACLAACQQETGRRVCARSRLPAQHAACVWRGLPALHLHCFPV